MMKGFYNVKTAFTAVSTALIKRMQDADILFVNNEFTFSAEGDGKTRRIRSGRIRPISVFSEIGSTRIRREQPHF